MERLPQMNEFVKSHGLGNDYFVLDGSRISFALTPGVIKLLCDRNYGIGSDGILLLVPSSRADFGLRILNPDGSEAEKSGNGLRIFAKYLYEHGHTDKKEFKIDTLGGIVEVQVHGVPFGLGTHAQWARKLDGRLAQAVMAVQAIKGVEIGLGFEAARRRGSQVHDPIRYDPSSQPTPTLGYERPTNNAGGLEAGMTNGQPIVVRAAKKPISTLRKPLESINLDTKEPVEASYERSDVCAISAASDLAS